MVRWRGAVVRYELALTAALALVAVATPAVLRSLRDPRPAGPPAGNASAPFPRGGDLALAGRVGDTLVGLTVRPARPGSNVVYAYLNPDPGPDASVQLTMAGDTRPMTPCGESCRTATVDLRGGTDLTLQVASVGATSFHVPPPATAADGLVERATVAMRGLGSYHVDQDFAGIRAAYDFVVPDRLYLRVWYGNGEQDTVWIGSTVYKRGVSGPWTATSSRTPPTIPYFNWFPFLPLVAAEVTGKAEIDGTPVTIVSAFGGHGDDPEPVWFTLWIDERTDLVLRSQMWAPAHFMDDRYSAFDQPADIRPPDDAE